MGSYVRERGKEEGDGGLGLDIHSFIHVFIHEWSRVAIGISE